MLAFVRYEIPDHTLNGVRFNVRAICEFLN